MLPTFVIGLREGLEAALIVGIVAAFLRQRGRSDLLRWVFAGVTAAVVLCLAVGITLDVVSSALPQRQQEGLETVVGACAVAMVTYMVIWMRRHSRSLKGQLEGAAGAALAAGSGFALVVMAFLAVMREGLETVVFLLAAFNENGNSTSAGIGALLGIVLAIGLGWGIYRGGVRLNLSRFFRITGIVLTFVAAGLVVTALHTAHEAGWLTIGQQRTVDLSALVRPGSVQESLLTGMLGVQSHPVLIEVIGWLVYLVPVGLYIAWPPGKGLSRSLLSKVSLLAAGVSVVAAVAMALLAPSRPAMNPVTRIGDGASAQLISRSSDGAVIAASVLRPAESTAVGAASRLETAGAGAAIHNGVGADVYTMTIREPVSGQPATMTYLELAHANGGRLPLGVRPSSVDATVAVTSTSVDTATFWIEPATGRIIDVAWTQDITLSAAFDIGPTTIGAPQHASWQLPVGASRASAEAANSDLDRLQQRSLLRSLALAAAVLGLLLAVAGLLLRTRRTGASVGLDAVRVTPRSELVRS